MDSGTSEGLCAGVHRMSALEFIARWLDHVPERYETRVRSYGAYATRRRVWWQRRGIVLTGAPPAAVGAAEPAADWPALRARRRRWAELLRRTFQIEGEVCPACGGAMRILAFSTELAVVRRMLAHLERGAGARLSDRRGACSERGASPRGRAQVAASGRAAGRVRARGTTARRGGRRRTRIGSARGAVAGSDGAWRSARASGERETDGEGRPGGRTLGLAR